jgi:GTP-binding protein
LSEFLDHLSLNLIAGKGGDGCISFRREKFVPHGGPDGGSGGRGGHVIFKASKNLNTLAHITPNAHIRAGRGVHGKGKKLTGARGDDQYVMVPLGTLVFDSEDGELLFELLKDGEEVIAAHGGNGGKGNALYVRSNRQTPRFAQPGEEGEKRRVNLELKLLADVGLLGLPNAGKSTLTSRISAAKPAIADYPFTTLYPVLGVVTLNYDSFVMADIPGLIEGAHKGVGLGHTFLRHIERTRILLHLVDVGTEDEDPVEQIKKLERELSEYSLELSNKPKVIVGNKIDLNPPEERLEQLRHYAELTHSDIFFISGVTGHGLDAMIKHIFKMLADLPRDDGTEEKTDGVEF